MYQEVVFQEGENGLDIRLSYPRKDGILRRDGRESVNGDPYAIGSPTSKIGLPRRW